MLDRWFALYFVRPYIAHELPGWGKLFELFVGGFRKNAKWEGAAPRIVREKRCGTYRIVNLEEWADRYLFFLRRWYDLEAALLIEALVKPGDRIVDVGGNYGHFSMEAAHATGPKGEVLTFEPNPASFARLSMHLQLNKLSHVRAYPIGISDSAGEMELSIPDINSGEATFGKSRYEAGTKVTCSVDTLDNVVGDRPVDFLKIDVEGFEPFVLRGAQTVLARSRPLVLTELVRAHLEAAGETPDNLGTILSDQGYRPFRIGLRKSGSRHEVSLAESSGPLADGDYLWVPSERVGAVQPLVVTR